MTPCEKLGYKVGDRFEIISSDVSILRKGSIVSLWEDDGTTSPVFRDSEGETWYCTIPGSEVDVGVTVSPIITPLKSGDEITQDGKKYRVTLEEIPQYEFKPGMICQVVWDGSEHCWMHSECTKVVYVGNNSDGSEQVAYAATDGDLAIGYVKTSNLRPE